MNQIVSDYRLNHVLMFNEEPFFEENIIKLFFNYSYSKSLKLLANSEHSLHKTKFCKENYFLDFYFFFHGFLALYWYNDTKYFQNTKTFKNSFLCLMNINNNDRSYRLYLASKLKEIDLLKKGTVSLNLDQKDSIKKEILCPQSKLSKAAKIHIFKNLTFDQYTIHADTKEFKGELSAELDHNVFEMWQNNFFHIVPETVFYYDKLHLTEKIFKPIVSRRPFVLVAAPGNLAYLKSYGFKTFDRWIDESYDDELDNDKRIDLIVEQIKNISELSNNSKENMLEEMQEVLEYNFNHFFGDFKKIIVNELVDNFEGCLNQWNNGRIDDKSIDKSLIDFNHIKTILLQ